MCDWCLKCELTQHTEYGRCRCVCLVFEIWTGPARWVWLLSLCVIGVWNVNSPSPLSMVVIVVCAWCLKCEHTQHAQQGRYCCMWLVFEMWTSPARWVWSLSLCVLGVWNMNWPSTLSMVVVVMCDWCLKCELAQPAEYGSYRCVCLVFEVWTYPARSAGSLLLYVIGVWNVN